MSKVLLVEDDNNLREIFEMRLQAEGYETVTAGDGEEALTVALAEKPDLIIADVMMPKLSGFEMIENLRAAPEMTNTKVIMMTALGQAEDRSRGENLGVLKYLVKSQVTLEDFVRVVRDVLPPGQAYSITNNQGGQTMPDDTTPTTNPTQPTDDSANAPADFSQTGQQSTADEQKTVDDQVNSFASGTATDSADVSAPAPDTSSTDAPAPAPTSEPTQPASSEEATPPSPAEQGQTPGQSGF